MKETITSYIGLDIHKNFTAIALAKAGRGKPEFIRQTPSNPAALVKALGRICKPDKGLVVYEAGPCGHGWARYLRKQGWNVDVIAPSRITRQAGEKRLKTDKRDAMLLARESRADNLTSIVVPDERDEAIRELSRARLDFCATRAAVQKQIKAMLLRHGRHYPGPNRGWTEAYERHLSTVRFDHPAQEITFTEYRQAYKDANERVQRTVKELREQCEGWRMNPVVKAVMCLKGFDFIAAVTVVSELGDMNRFAHPKALMSYLGLVPSEFSSGNSRRQGSITKAGNKHARRVLIEAAWNNRHKAKIGRDLEIRQQGQPKVIRDISWKAQQRLSKRYRNLAMGRGVAQNKICVAIARELSGFIWAIAREVKLKP